MHTFSRFARPYQRSCAAFSTVPVGNQIVDYFLLSRRDIASRAGYRSPCSAWSCNGRRAGSPRRRAQVWTGPEPAGARADRSRWWLPSGAARLRAGRRHARRPRLRRNGHPPGSPVGPSGFAYAVQAAYKREMPRWRLPAAREDARLQSRPGAPAAVWRYSPAASNVRARPAARALSSPSLPRFVSTLDIVRSNARRSDSESKTWPKSPSRCAAPMSVPARPWSPVTSPSAALA